MMWSLPNAFNQFQCKFSYNNRNELHMRIQSLVQFLKGEVPASLVYAVLSMLRLREAMFVARMASHCMNPLDFFRFTNTK